MNARFLPQQVTVPDEHATPASLAYRFASRNLFTGFFGLVALQNMLLNNFEVIHEWNDVASSCTQ
jgi:hypothetical protein